VTWLVIGGVAALLVVAVADALRSSERPVLAKELQRGVENALVDCERVGAEEPALALARCRMFGLYGFAHSRVPHLLGDLYRLWFTRSAEGYTRLTICLS
jgi:hypothetical protein